MGKQNLIHITYSLDVGGIERLVLDLVKKLNENKYKICVCALSNNLKLRDEFAKVNVPVYSLPKKDGIDFALPFKLMRLFRQNKTDIIHTHNIGPWLYGTIAARLTGVRAIVHTEHSNLFLSQNKLMIAERYLVRFTSYVISDSVKVYKHLVDLQKVNSDKIKIIYNGINTDVFRSERSGLNLMRKELNLKENSKMIGIVARLEPVKDHLTLLNAFKIVTEKIPGSILLIVGDGSQRIILKQKVAELKLNQNILFLGSRGDIPNILSALDVFVLSSENEGLSLSLLEAMAMGKPVVATNAGGNPEIVTDGITGMLVPQKNPQKMAEAIVKILKNQDIGRKMGEAGRKRVEEKFSLDRMVREYEALYEECLSRPKIGNRRQKTL